MDEKSPDAFRTISEAAEELDLPQHVLRFWESRFREIRPMKRGGGRRYYRPDDLDLLRGIKHLLYGEGYTIRGVQRILREQGIKFVQAVWEEGAEQPAQVAGEAIPEDVEPELFEQDGSLGERLTSFIGRDLNNKSDEHRREPMLGGSAPQLGPADRVIPAGPVAEQIRTEPRTTAPSLAREQVETLRTVLQDLMECRKLIDAAVARQE
jgi:DNA-binding transcriptional MerR regulator